MNHAECTSVASPYSLLRPRRHRDNRGILEVINDHDLIWSPGRAHLAGWRLGVGGAIATYRVVMGDDDLPGLFILVGQRLELLVA